MSETRDRDYMKRLEHEQEKHASRVCRSDLTPFKDGLVTGVDVAYSDALALACGVTVDIVDRQVIETRYHLEEVSAPYIPGLFQLREGPPLIHLLEEWKPDGPVLIDGNGVLHPRRFGLACFVGLELGIQTIGVAKRLLIGSLGNRMADRAYVLDGDEVIGAALWIGEKTRPVYVSIGHGVSLATAVDIVRQSAWDGRVQPLHQAHLMAKQRLRELL